jgi:hypothetical protein
MRWRTRFAARVVLAALALAASAANEKPAGAQVHGDVSAQVGVMKRFFSDSAGGQPGFGPAVQLTGGVALLPLLQVGGYFGHDISPLPSPAAARDITFGGLRLRGNVPWPGGQVRTWIFVGFGYAGVYSRSYATTLAVPDGLGGTTPQRVTVEGAGGSFFDLPFGIGASYKLRKPWELCAELAMRTGFGHTGSVYESPGPQVNLPGNTGQNVAPAGTDRFALGLTVGVLVDL